MANAKRKLHRLKRSCAWGCGRLLTGGQTICEDCEARERDLNDSRHTDPAGVRGSRQEAAPGVFSALGVAVGKYDRS
jgi:hypothetical protein